MNPVRLQREFWLGRAKQLYVGGSTRTNLPNHRGDRESLLIRNTEESWNAWDFRLNQGDIVRKEYIIKTQLPPESRSAVYPDDATLVRDLPLIEQEQLWSFLLTKGVDGNMLPDNLEKSEDRQRILFITECGNTLGRDVTGKSSTKWVTYGKPKQSYVGIVQAGKIPVLVEDLLSYYKLRYALRDTQYSPIALLGTAIRPDLAYSLSYVDKVHIMLDGDVAGRRAVPKIRKSLLNTKSFNHDLPDGLDPKDLTINQIRSLFNIG